MQLDSLTHTAKITKFKKYVNKFKKYTSDSVISTSNVTAVTKVQSASAHLFASKWRPLMNVITTLLLCCNYFSSLSVESCAFSAHIRENKSLGIILIP